jgi:hypothetical protein
LKNAKAKALFMPWSLSSLAEHEECFQQWCVLQLLVGIIVTVAVLILYVMWVATEDTAIKIPMGPIIMNAVLRFAMAFLATWIVWFGVIAKHGCCCLIVCCFLGKPNILVVAIVEGIFALSTALTVLQALDHGHILLIFAAAILGTHFVTQIYLTAEAFMVWFKSRDASTTSDKETVGPPVILGTTSEKQGDAVKGVADTCTKGESKQENVEEKQDCEV